MERLSARVGWCICPPVACRARPTHLAPPLAGVVRTNEDGSLSPQQRVLTCEIHALSLCRAELEAQRKALAEATSIAAMLKVAEAASKIASQCLAAVKPAASAKTNGAGGGKVRWGGRGEALGRRRRLGEARARALQPP